ncbi:hypothetical protein CW304_10705 [Bacillus sp. UFRGS-B20]|nr:hypothetical protein CW304_10705 [Bacillus sp. UFRGS-B20]
MTIWIGQLWTGLLSAYRIPIIVTAVRSHRPGIRIHRIRTHMLCDYNNAQLDNTLPISLSTCIPHIPTDYSAAIPFASLFNTLPMDHIRMLLQSRCLDSSSTTDRRPRGIISDSITCVVLCDFIEQKMRNHLRK